MPHVFTKVVSLSKRRLLLLILAILLLLFAVVVGAYYALGLEALFQRQPLSRQGTVTWEDKGPIPMADEGYSPQGLTWVNGKLIFANSWKNTKSRVYEIDPATMEVLRHFDMPAGAVHTSGLAWDGHYLWAVDYISNQAYCLDLETSFREQSAKEIGRFDTTLKGSSACCIIPLDGKKYLAISDFMRTRQTIVVDKEKALQARTAADAVAWAYQNEGFSQGLECVDGFIYESENKWGIDVINKMDVNTLRQTKSARMATVLQYPAPGNGVEDLAWDGEAMWTSDEHAFRFFRGTFR